MNKRDREQLRASIAKDLGQGQGKHSPTKELLKQYAPLEGIVTTPAPDISRRPGSAQPVENSLAPHATVAQKEHSPWHGATVAPAATVAPPATVERLATVKGELRVPNTINFSLFPTLNPFAKAVYYQLFLLSHGFRRDTCVVGLAKLAKLVLMSQRKVQDTITYLETRGLIKRLRAVLGGPSKGSVYQVPLPATGTAPGATVAESANVAGDATVAPPATVAPETTVARDATNKYDDDSKNKSSSKGQKFAGDLWKTTVAGQSRERDRKMPIGNLRSSAPRTSEQPGTGGGSRIPKPTTKMASRKCQQKQSSPPWKPSPGALPPRSTVSNISSEKSSPPGTRATAPGRRSSSRRLFGESGIARSVARAFPGSISLRTSNAHAPAKVSHSTTIFSTNWSAKTA